MQHIPLELDEFKKLTPKTNPDDDRIASAKLLIELRTRISTQRLHYRSGDEETAATSIHSLFATVRSLLAEHPEALKFEMLAVCMLNKVIRDHTARWHGWMVNDRFKGEDQRRMFRHELQELRHALKQCDVIFSKIRDKGRIYARDLVIQPRQDTASDALLTTVNQNAFAQVPAGIGHQVRIGTNGSFDVIDSINDEETDEIIARRQLFETTSSEADPETGTVVNATGLALSGGGIRSATFCLGVVQSLAKRRLFEQFDYLSTVSGGGYLGTFLSSYLNILTPDTEPDTLAESAAPAPTRNANEPANEPADEPDDEPDDEKDESIEEKKEDGRIFSAMRQSMSQLKSHGEEWVDEPAVDLKDQEAKDEARQQAEDKIREIFDHDSGTDTAPIRHLRNNSKYLLNGGFLGKARDALLVVFGIIMNLACILPFIGAAAVATIWVKGWNYWGETDWTLKSLEKLSPDFNQWFDASAAWDTFGLLGIAALCCGLILGPAVSLFTRGAAPASFRNVLQGGMGTVTTVVSIAAIAAGLVAAIPLAFVAVTWLESRPSTDFQFKPLVDALTPLAGVFPLVAAPLFKRFHSTRFLGTLLKVLLILSGPIFYFGIYIIISRQLLHAPDEHDAQAIWLVVAVAALLLFLLDLNGLSPHRLYRDRVAGCYLVKRGPGIRGLVGRVRDWFFHGREITPAETIGQVRKLDLSKLGATHAAPYHLINCALNLPASKRKRLRGRNSDFFLFSKKFYGSPITGYHPTDQLEERDPAVDLGSAMAISGAAFSSNMGVKKLEHLRFFLTLFNIRLGYWLPNPNRKYPLPKPLWSFHAPGPFYLLREMFGFMHEANSYLNVSDGGHIENLGIYELLRRKCKFIVAVDGEQDGTMTFDGLIKLIRYAKIDLGADIEIDLSDFTKDEHGFSRSHSALGKVIYHDGSIGWLMYFKLSLTGNEDPFVLDYRRQEPAFPHQSTIDQLFSERQFEAYRNLGEHAAEDMFRRELFDVVPDDHDHDACDGHHHDTDPVINHPVEIEDWFRVLILNLLPDNDPVFRDKGDNP